jgi:MFS family permease
VQLLNKLPSATAARNDLSRARAAVTAFFAMDGFVFATWAVRIPAVKAAVGASPATLGVALLGVSVGAIATMALTGALCRRIGSARVIVIALPWLSFALLLPALARSAPALGLGLVVFGIGYGGLNVAMNSLAVDLVAAIRRPIMPSFHAAWSLGGLAGAALGGLLAPALSPLVHFSIVCAAGIALTVVCGRMVLTAPLPAADPGAEVTRQPSPGEGTSAPVPEIPIKNGLGSPMEHSASPSRPQAWRVVLLLGAIALCSTYAEGAVSDWGALHLRQDLGAAPGLAAAGYAAFALAEAGGRLGGTTLLTRLGQTRVLVFGGLVTCVGMIAAALSPVLPLALVGYALAGLGVANAFPTAMTRVGILGGPNGVAAASTLGYAGFLLGPPAIGFLATALSLRVALTTVSLLALVGVALARVAARSQPEPAASAPRSPRAPQFPRAPR